MLRLWNLLLAACTLAPLGSAQAHTLSVRECAEVGEFLKHAAMSRDYGISREEFIGRVQSDIVLVQAYPPELRWIVQDAKDEAMLIDAVEIVFDSPAAPESHESEFVQACERRFAQQE